MEQLVALLPEALRQKLMQHEEIEELVEIVLDLGRPATARFPSGDWAIGEGAVSWDDLAVAVAAVGEFADDNRAGIDRTLHRVSAIRNRAGRVVGLTCRVGRAVSGSAEMVRDLVAGGASLLLMGPPGVGKTTAIREVGRMLADEYRRRVVIVDTSNEIGGDGEIAHAGIGRARRMQVPRVELQHQVMIEAVENHMPQTVVVDEIGTEREAAAAGTIAQRGVQLVATAHGMTVDNLIKNPSLQALAGGVQSVTLGDDEARRRGVQKSVLERMGPPTFAAAVEMVSRVEWRVHRRLAATVDALLAGRVPLVEVRRMEQGKVVVSAAAGVLQLSQPQPVAGDRDDGDSSDDDESDGDDADGPGGRSGLRMWRQGDPPLQLYAYQVTGSSVEQVVEVMGLHKAVQLTHDIAAADAILALRSKLKHNSWVRGIAKLRQLPIFAIKANTMAQMVRAMRAILGMESLLSNSYQWVSSSDHESLKAAAASSSPGLSAKETTTDPKSSAAAPSSSSGTTSSSSSRGSLASSADSIDALEEARVAVEQIVIPKGQPVELLPRSVDIICLQEKLAEQYQLATERAGSAAKLRLRILPMGHGGSGGTHSPPSTSITSSNVVVETDEGLMNGSGTSVNRLPILPE